MCEGIHGFWNCMNCVKKPVERYRKWKQKAFQQCVHLAHHLDLIVCISELFNKKTGYLG
jgi:hypothetical protein